ncbi:ribonuclease H-like domain-containing protein [Tanacetum coccineum]|uniref:Ribonuclease H-like domain-containing protein n=1 Tax=Tanacetum coccineum TaxID=301880 RepID=A0ABQ5EGZ2_9ASTR
MDQETPQTTTTAKLPILKQGEYDMWRLRIEQYFQVQDYALWDVIENGNSFKPAAQTTTNADGTSTSLIPGPVTTKEKAQKKNDVKARSMLLMALPNEHLMTFNQYKDAKTLFAAIQTRFGGNEATKKTQKTLLKQMYENFNASSTKSLDSIFNRLQKIVSQLAILGENISQEDLNLKFLRSLPSEWNTHVVSSSSQNMAFVSSPSSTNEVNTAYGVSTTNTQVSPTSPQVSTTSTQVSTTNLSDDTVYAFLSSQPNGSQLVYEDLKQIHEDDTEEIDLKWQLALLSMRTKRFFQKTGRKITINGCDTAGYDKSKVKCFNCHKMGHFARECRGPRNQDSRNRNQDSSRRTINVEETSSKAMVAIDGAGFDWSYMADHEVPTNMALMAFSESELKKLKQEKESNQLKIENFDNASKSRDKLIGSQITDKSRKGMGFVNYNAVPPSPTGLFSLPKFDLSNSSREDFQHPKFKGYGSKTSKSVSEDISNEVRESPDAPLVEELVLNDNLEKKIVFPIITKIEFVRPKQQEKPVRKPVNFDHVQADCNYHKREWVVSGNIYTRVNYKYITKKAHPSAHKNKVPRAVLMKTGLRSLNTARPKVVNTARPKSTVVNDVRENQGHPQKEDQGYIDSGCSRHMTGNMSCLSYFKEFDGVYIVEQEVKETTSSSSSSSSQNMAFVSSPSSTNKVNTAYGVSTANTQVSPASTQVSTTSTQKTGKNITINGSDTAGYDKSKVECFNCHKMGHFTREKMQRTYSWWIIDGESTPHLGFDVPVGSQIPDKSRKGVGFVSYNAVQPPPIGLFSPLKFDLSNSGLEEFQQLEFEGYGPKPSKSFSEDTSNEVRESLDAPLVEELVSDDKLEKKTVFPTIAKIEFIRPKQQEKLVRKPVKYAEMYRSQSHKAGGAVGMVLDLCKAKGLVTALGILGGLVEMEIGNAEKKDDEGVSKASGIDDQERLESFFTAPLEATHADFFDDETEVDISIITTIYPVPSTPNIRIHKDHSLDHVIRDVLSGVQTRRMTKTTNEQGFISAVYEEKTYEDLQNCLFAYFLSQVEPKKAVSLAYASFQDFVVFVYQMNVKSAFLYGKIEEEVHVCQPPGFEDPEFPNKVYKVEKALYGLHQAPRAWYETLSTYLLDNGFQRGELTFFLILQVTQKDDGIFISQDKYVDKIVKKFGFSTVKIASTPMETSKPLLKDAKAKDIDVYLYRSMIGLLMYLTTSRPDIMFAVCACVRFQFTPKVSHLHAVKRIFRYLKDRKFTTGGCQFLGSRLISWQCKKQTIVANSTTEAEYVAASNETFIKEWEDRMERAATTTSSLEAEQDSGNINRTQSMETLNESFPQGTGSVLVYAAWHSLTAVRHKLMMPGINYYCWFWTTVKAKIVNGERQIQVLVDNKKVIITEISVRSDLQLDDAEGTECLPNDTIFEQLTLMGFSSRITPLFATMMVQAPEDMGEGSAAPTYPYPTPIITYPSLSKPSKKQSRRKQRKDSRPTERITDEATNEEHVSTPSYDLPQSGKDRMQLNELMDLCTKLSDNVLALENNNTSQAVEIATLKELREK